MCQGLGMKGIDPKFFEKTWDRNGEIIFTLLPIASNINNNYQIEFQKTFLRLLQTCSNKGIKINNW